jgi:hypothetical protein
MGITTIMETASKIFVREATRGEVTVLSVDGVLDGGTYLPLRDRIITAALDRPTAVVVDISALRVPAASAYAVFTSARWQVSRWPDVPVLLVCRSATARSAARSQGITLHVPVFDCLEAACAAVGGIGPRLRCRRSAELTPIPGCARQARELVTEWLWDWGYDDVIPTANVIVTELVDNVYAHADGSAAALRVEALDGEIAIAVSDRNVRLPTRTEAVRDAFRVSGLQVVAALADTWGCAPTSGGKTVWATIASDG